MLSFGDDATARCSTWPTRGLFGDDKNNLHRESSLTLRARYTTTFRFTSERFFRARRERGENEKRGWSRLMRAWCT